MAFIAGAGNINIDLLYSGMPRIPQEGEELYARDFSLQLGGGMPATLITLARLGVKTKIVTQLGTDMFSDFAIRELKKAGADYHNLYRGDAIPLTITSAVILPHDRTFFSYGGYEKPDDRMKEEFYRLASGAKIVLMETGGYLDVYKKLKAEGSLLVLDTGWDDDLSLDTYGEYLELADYYTPNRKEALKITGTDTPEGAAQVLSKYFNKVVVKLDRDGCLGMENGEHFIVPEISRFKNTDSTGAGDAFLAGFCYGLFYDYPLKDCILFGNITGGNAVTKVGALSAKIDEKTLLQIADEAK